MTCLSKTFTLLLANSPNFPDSQPPACLPAPLLFKLLRSKVRRAVASPGCKLHRLAYLGRLFAFQVGVSPHSGGPELPRYGPCLAWQNISNAGKWIFVKRKERFGERDVRLPGRRFSSRFANNLKLTWLVSSQSQQLNAKCCVIGIQTRTRPETLLLNEYASRADSRSWAERCSTTCLVAPSTEYASMQCRSGTSSLGLRHHTHCTSSLARPYRLINSA
jgi:hypothetical protein